MSAIAQDTASNEGEDDQFMSPLSSPSEIDPPQNDIVKSDSTVSGTSVTAVGTQAEASTGRGSVGSDDDARYDSDPDTVRGGKGRVVFRDQQLTETFDDTDLWTRGGTETAQDMINAYQRECMSMKVKPIQILLDQLKGVYDLSVPIDTIDLTGVKLDNRTCEVLEAVLSRVTSTTLKLERTNLEDEGVIALFEMVEFYGCACRLLLAHNNKLRPRAWLTVGRTLKKSPFLTTIDVSYCALDEQTLTLLLRAVRANCGLKVLKIEGNNLTGKGTVILMAAMKFNENLEELHLSRNHLAPSDGQCLGNILRSNHTLRVLDVSDNNLQDAGIRYISAGVAEQQEGLYVLNVSTNNLTHDGIHHLSAMLPCTKSLKELNISNNKFSDTGLFMLKLGILANRSVEKLSLSGTKITCEGAIALAEVLAESKYLTHVDLRENEIKVAGLMALCLALRMNHHLLYLETPKSFKVEQRDRQLTRDLVVEMDKYRSRNHKEKEVRDREKARQSHEESHLKESAGKNNNDQMKETMPVTEGVQEEDDEDKEVDPSLVGSLDNVYNEDTEAEMMKEDPFQNKAPVVDKDHVPSTYEIEESVNALLVYSSDSDSTSPLPEDEDTSLTGSIKTTTEATPTSATPPSTTSTAPHATHTDPLDLLTSSNDMNTLTDVPLVPDSTQDLLPDLIGTTPTQQVDPSPLNHVLPPDVTPQVIPPDLAAESQQPIDLLNSDSGRSLDLTEGIINNSPDVTIQ